MNHRYRQAPPHPCRRPAILKASAAIALSLAVSFGAGVTPAYAQRAGTLPMEVKSAPDARIHKQTIETFVQTQVAALQNGQNPAGQQHARDLLASQASSTASPSYLDIYADSLNRALLPLANPKVPVRTRMLAAVTLYKVAKTSSSGKLADAATAFAQDESVAVSLWGIRASQPVI